MKSQSALLHTAVSGPARGLHFRARRAAFTLVELLTVIAIIGVLAAIIIPVVGKVRKTAYRTKEVAAARFLMQAYLLASDQDNRGFLIPGKQNYNEATGKGVVTGYDEAGNPLTAYQASIWSHRIRPYLGERFLGTLFINKQEDYWHGLSSSANYDALARYFTTFGHNERWIGADSYGNDKETYPSLNRINQAILPSGLLVFVGATNHSSGIYQYAGNWRVQPPDGGSWANAKRATGPRDDEEALESGWGFIAFRYDGKAVAAFLDGHVELKGHDELKDMRLWSNDARAQNNPRFTAGYLD